MAAVGIKLSKDSIRQLIAQRSTSFSTVGLVVFAISVVIKEGLARFSIWAGKKTDRIASHSLQMAGIIGATHLLP